MKHILFRVNAGAASGLGHLMRCLALAQAAAKNKLSPVFMLNAETAVISQSRQDWVGQVIVMPEFKSDIHEITFIANFCLTHSVVAVVIDGYHFTPLYRQQLASLNYPVVCFDDMNNSGNLHANIIINGAGNSNQLGYEFNQAAAQLCIGDSYRILREEFCDLKPVYLEQRKYLTIMMGGSDPANLTIPLLEALENIGFEGEVQLITGAAYPFSEQLKQQLLSYTISVKHLHDCQQVAQSFMQTRLAISAAGGSQFELHATATPSCLITVADNQLGATQAAVKQGWCITEDISNIRSENDKQQRIEIVVKRVLALWSAKESLVKMHNNALLTCDTKGTQRVIEQIQELAFAE